jgi:hypothetical protein
MGCSCGLIMIARIFFFPLSFVSFNKFCFEMFWWLSIEVLLRDLPLEVSVL